MKKKSTKLKHLLQKARSMHKQSESLIEEAIIEAEQEEKMVAQK